MQWQQSIHRHQTLPRSRNAVRCAILRDVKSVHAHTAHYRPNATSSIKPEVHHVAQRQWRRSNPQPQDLHTQFCADRSSGSRDMLTVRQTDRWVDDNTPHPYQGGVTKTWQLMLHCHLRPLMSKFRGDRCSGSWDMLTVRQTDRQTGWSQYSEPLLGRSN